MDDGRQLTDRLGRGVGSKVVSSRQSFGGCQCSAVQHDSDVGREEGNQRSEHVSK